MSVIIIIEYA